MYAPEELELIPDRGKRDPMRFKRRLNVIKEFAENDPDNLLSIKILAYLRKMEELELTDW